MYLSPENKSNFSFCHKAEGHREELLSIDHLCTSEPDRLPADRTHGSLEFVLLNLRVQLTLTMHLITNSLQEHLKIYHTITILQCIKIHDLK